MHLQIYCINKNSNNKQIKILSMTSRNKKNPSTSFIFTEMDECLRKNEDVQMAIQKKPHAIGETGAISKEVIKRAAFISYSLRRLFRLQLLSCKYKLSTYGKQTHVDIYFVILNLNCLLKFYRSSNR